MASQYNLEPQPNAKVILNTTAGDLTLELFGKQTPLATRNFLQHCLDGYYNNSIFHRLVPGFIIQGGDPTGTGSGGISAINNGEPFEDEIHSRLKYNRRGLLGMANEGANTNTSQFFFTLAATPELQGKNTMFGRIEGDTVFNLMKMGDAEMSENDRPLYPTKITGSEILVNPFADMTARAGIAERSSALNDKDTRIKKRKKPMGKNVLSFEEDGDAAAVPVLKKAKVNPKMLASTEAKREVAIPVIDLEEAEAKPSKTMPQQEKAPDIPPQPVATKPRKPVASTPRQPVEEPSDDEDDARRDQRNALERTNAEIAALKASMRRDRVVEEKVQEKPKSVLEEMIPATSTRGRKRGKVQDDSHALALFNAFKQKLEDMPSNLSQNSKPQEEMKQDIAESGQDDTNAPADDDEAELCDLHFIANCQSCKSWDADKPDEDAEANGDDDPGWMSHKLTFARDTLGKDLEWKRKMEEIEVIDPREKARAIMDESRRSKQKKR